MNALVLDAHHDRPEGIVPVDGQCQRQGRDHAVDQGTHLVTVGLDLGDRRPVVVGIVEIVPGHFVDTDGEHRLRNAG